MRQAGNYRRLRELQPVPKQAGPRTWCVSSASTECVPPGTNPSSYTIPLPRQLLECSSVELTHASVPPLHSMLIQFHEPLELNVYTHFASGNWFLDTADPHASRCAIIEEVLYAHSSSNPSCGPTGKVTSIHVTARGFPDSTSDGVTTTSGSGSGLLVTSVKGTTPSITGTRLGYRNGDTVTVVKAPHPPTQFRVYIDCRISGLVVRPVRGAWTRGPLPSAQWTVASAGPHGTPLLHSTDSPNTFTLNDAKATGSVSPLDTHIRLVVHLLHNGVRGAMTQDVRKQRSIPPKWRAGKEYVLNERLLGEDGVVYSVARHHVSPLRFRSRTGVIRALGSITTDGAKTSYSPDTTVYGSVVDAGDPNLITDQARFRGVTSGGVLQTVEVLYGGSGYREGVSYTLAEDSTGGNAAMLTVTVDNVGLAGVRITSSGGGDPSGTYEVGQRGTVTGTNVSPSPTFEVLEVTATGGVAKITLVDAGGVSALFSSDTELTLAASTIGSAYQAKAVATGLENVYVINNLVPESGDPPTGHTAYPMAHFYPAATSAGPSDRGSYRNLTANAGRLNIPIQDADALEVEFVSPSGTLATFPPKFTHGGEIEYEPHYLSFNVAFNDDARMS